MKDSNLPPLSESMQEQLLKELELNFPMDETYSPIGFKKLGEQIDSFILAWRTQHDVL